MVPLEQQS